MTALRRATPLRRNTAALRGSVPAGHLEANRKLTLDYGLRWDLQTAVREIQTVCVSFSATTPNPNANGLLGAVIYAGFGAGRCNCHLVPTYPYAIAPRLGLAYQLNAKTVIRAGWGLSYGSLAPTG